MKIFSWMQSKLNGKQVTKQPNAEPSNHNRPPQEPCKEEFSDWPQALFAIGTFGNSTLKEEPERLNPLLTPISCQNHPQAMSSKEFAELRKLLQDKQTNPADESVTVNFSSKELEETHSEEDSVNRDENNPLQRSGSVEFSRGRDIYLDNTKNAIDKRTFSFLLKKMLICSSGFSHVPNLRDSLPEVKIEKSRIQKLLRDLLHKKIYPQSSTPKATQKYIERNHMCSNDSNSNDEMFYEGNDGGKWVKTDSEYIVLEI